MVFVCDVQERFRSVISHMPYVIDTARRVVGSCERVLYLVRLLHAHTRVNPYVPQIRGADALHIPVVCTEQVSTMGVTAFQTCKPCWHTSCLSMLWM